MQATIFPQGISAIASPALYADILAVFAPAEANAGEQVPVKVHIKNISTARIIIGTSAIVLVGTDAVDSVVFPSDWIELDPGISYQFEGYFTMPNSSVRVEAYSYWYSVDDIWHLDDTMEAYITLVGIPEYAGSITGKFINKSPEGFRIPIPTEVAADNNTFEVGVKYKNFSGRTITAGCEVKVWDPDGTLRASPAIDWTGMAHNEELETQYNICRVDKPGTWTVKIRFLTYDNVELDSYEGLLFTAVVEEYAGTIISQWINKSPEGFRIPLPTTVTADGHTFEVGVRYRNNSSVTFTGGVEVVVVDPDNMLRAHPAIDWTGMSPNEELEKQYNICPVDKVGIWRIYLRFWAKDGPSVIIDEVETSMEAIGEEYAGSLIGKWINKAPEGNRISIPTEVTADNNTFEVGVRYKNLSGRTVPYCGCKVEVWDPDGILRASPAVDWTGMAHNEELETQYNICPVDKAGDWTIHIDFLLDSTEVVDTYDGLLFTAVAVEYAGTIISQWINKAPEGNRISIPTEVTADNNTFEVGVRYKNLSGRTVPYCGCKVEVWDPDGILRASPAVDWTGMAHNEELETQYNICAVDKVGDWTIHIDFLLDSTEVVDTYDGLLFTAVPAYPDSEFREGSFAITGYDGVPIDEKLMVIPGQTVTFHMTVDYRGPAIDGSIYTAIGWKGIYFLPTFSSKIPIHLDASFDFATYEFDCDVDIKTLDPLEELAYGTILDVYAKIVEVPGADIYTPFYIGVIAWSKPPEEYELIQHTISHFAYIYDGDAEITTVTLKTDPFKPADWVPEKFIAELEREARESGVRVLETKVYVDTSPLLWTDYKIEVIGTPSGEVTGAAVGALPVIPLWVKLIIGVLAVAFLIIIITWSVTSIAKVFKRKPGLADMKPMWGKEALILDIKDTEWHLEREGRLVQPVTPTETLEGMSEEELREHLDKLGEIVVPPGLEIPLLALVAVGGLAVLGVGAAVALAPRKKE